MRCVHDSAAWACLGPARVEVAILVVGWNACMWMAAGEGSSVICGWQPGVRAQLGAAADAAAAAAAGAAIGIRSGGSAAAVCPPVAQQAGAAQQSVHPCTSPLSFLAACCTSLMQHPLIESRLVQVRACILPSWLRPAWLGRQTASFFDTGVSGPYVL